jgi:hypothetical protein
VEVGGSKLEAGQGKSRRPYLKNQTKRQRTGDIAQGVEHLPSKCNAPSLIPSSTERERQREREKTKKKGKEEGREGARQKEGSKTTQKVTVALISDKVCLKMINKSKNCI